MQENNKEEYKIENYKINKNKEDFLTNQSHNNEFIKEIKCHKKENESENIKIEMY